MNRRITIEKDKLWAVAYRAMTSAWRQPLPLKRPEVDPELPFLPFTQRVAEVFRFNLLEFEYALSSGGGLREYLKFNLRIAAFLVIPAVLIGTTLTIIFTYVHTLSALLLSTLINVLLSLVVLILIVAIVTSAPFIMKEFRSKR